MICAISCATNCWHTVVCVIWPWTIWTPCKLLQFDWEVCIKQVVLFKLEDGLDVNLVRFFYVGPDCKAFNVPSSLTLVQSVAASPACTLEMHILRVIENIPVEQSKLSCLYKTFLENFYEFYRYLWHHLCTMNLLTPRIFARPHQVSTIYKLFTSEVNRCFR